MAIFSTPRPGTLWCKVAAARRALLEKPRQNLPNKPNDLMPPVTIPERQFRALQSAILHASRTQMAALTRTPLAIASSSTEFLTAWAILGTWTCTCVWSTPDYARWLQACCPVNRTLAERKPYLGGWTRSSFEQGAFCALLAAMSSSASRYCAIHVEVIAGCPEGVPLGALRPLRRFAYYADHAVSVTTTHGCCRAYPSYGSRR